MVIHGAIGAATLRSLSREYFNNLSHKHLFFYMKTNIMTEIKGYEAPNFDVVLTVVERGFEASYGDFGEAGDGYDIDDNGDF